MFRSVGSAIATVSVRPRRLKRQNEVLGCKIRRNERQDLRVDVHLAQIDGRDAVLLPRDARQVVLGDEIQIHQAVSEAHTGLLLLRPGSLQILWRDEPFLEQSLHDLTFAGRQSVRLERDRSMLYGFGVRGHRLPSVPLESRRSYITLFA